MEGRALKKFLCIGGPFNNQYQTVDDLKFVNKRDEYIQYNCAYSQPKSKMALTRMRERGMVVTDSSVLIHKDLFKCV